MKANPAHAGLTRWEKKKVLKSRVLPLAEDFGALRHTGPSITQLADNLKATENTDFSAEELEKIKKIIQK